ncbi:hypothetical protein HPB50_006482 [Hyalomma asiaticum]|uniref:Uncharacterized protein n=1 Tax=Hyalomma asiaticum TaxID=266040 RepID=A0ACB7SZZ2_HYAAI|nr:hypothetical protein HPB50_006482 [Hyalomma asiaticum]
MSSRELSLRYSALPRRKRFARTGGVGVRITGQSGRARSTLLQRKCGEWLKGAYGASPVASACDVNHNARAREKVATKNHRHGKTREVHKALAAHALLPSHNQPRGATRGSDAAREMEGSVAGSHADGASTQMSQNLIAEQRDRGPAIQQRRKLSTSDSKGDERRRRGGIFGSSATRHRSQRLCFTITVLSCCRCRRRR